MDSNLNRYELVVFRLKITAVWKKISNDKDLKVNNLSLPNFIVSVNVSSINVTGKKKR